MSSTRHRRARVRRLPVLLLCGAASVLAAAPALAQQRSSENALAASDDAFGSVVGNERTGLYSDTDVRGFSPVRAGNIRVEGVYFDQQVAIQSRARAGSRIRVGIAALDYPFPAPTGIADYQLRTPTAKPSIGLQAIRNYFGGYILEVDLRGPIIKERLTLTMGASALRQEETDGSSSRVTGYGAVPRLKLGDRGEITLVAGHVANRDQLSRVLISAPAAYLPPLVQPRKYLGQDWAKGSAENSNFGGIWRQAIGSNMTLRSGAFFSRQLVHRAFTEVITVTDPTGGGRHAITADPARRLQSLSGETQLTVASDSDTLKNRFLFTVRARSRLGESGGSDARDLGPVRLGELDPEQKPSFTFRGLDKNRIRQVTGAAGYMGRWVGVGQLNLGIQKTDYRQTFQKLGAAKTTTEASPWLYNGAVMLAPGPNWLVYASYAKGLEESGVAPENAVNRNETLLPSRTTQVEAGGRIKWSGLTLSSSAFRIQKPYFALDAGNRFTDLGQVRHQGVEASLSGTVRKRLNFTLGAVLMKPVVTGEARTLGRVGQRPVGVSSTVVRLDAEYQVPRVRGLSTTASVLANGRRAASVRPYAELNGKQLFAPGFTTVDLGVRYRFTIDKKPLTARAVLANAFDNRSWRVAQANTYQLNDVRRLALYLSADF